MYKIGSQSIEQNIYVWLKLTVDSEIESAEIQYRNRFPKNVTRILF